MRKALAGLCGLGALSAALLAPGCSSKDSDGAPSSASASDGGVSGSSAAVLAPNAHVVETDPLSVTATSVTFTTNAEIQSLQVGDTIAPAKAATALSTPYLATIASIAADSPSPGQTSFTITQAALDDLFSQAQVDETAAITAGDPDSVAPIDASSPNLLANPIGSIDPLTFMALPSGGKIWQLGSEGALSLSGNGSLDMSESSFSISGGVGFTYEKAPGLTLLPDHLRLVFNGGMSITVGAKISTTGAVTYLFPNTQYGPDLVLGAIVFFAGPVPIPIVVSLAFAGSAQIGVMGAMTMHEAVTGTFNMSAGVDWTSAGGATGVFDHQALINYAPFTATGMYSTAFRLVPVLATLKFSLLGVAGPSVTVAPSVGVQVSPQADGGSTVVGTYGVATLLGGSLTIFDHTISGLNLTLFSVSGTFPLCLPGSLVCSGGPLVASK